MDESSPRLALLKVLIGAFLLPWRERSRYLRALVVPTLIAVIVWAAWALLATDSSYVTALIFMPLYGLAFSLFAVTCHRLVLIAAANKSPRSGSPIHQRVLVFFLWLIAVYFIVAMVKMLVMTLVMNLPGVVSLMSGGRDSEVSEQIAGYMVWIQSIASIPSLYVLGRLSLVFPSIAMDRRLTLQGSWQLSSGNGWRLFVVVGLLPWLMAVLLSLFAREGSTVVEQSLLALLMYATMAVEVFALSLAFRELVMARSADEVERPA